MSTKFQFFVHWFCKVLIFQGNKIAKGTDLQSLFWLKNDHADRFCENLIFS